MWSEGTAVGNLGKEKTSPKILFEKSRLQL